MVSVTVTRAEFGKWAGLECLGGGSGERQEDRHGQFQRGAYKELQAGPEERVSNRAPVVALAAPPLLLQLLEKGSRHRSGSLYPEQTSGEQVQNDQYQIELVLGSPSRGEWRSIQLCSTQTVLGRRTKRVESRDTKCRSAGVQECKTHTYALYTSTEGFLHT